MKKFLFFILLTATILLPNFAESKRNIEFYTLAQAIANHANQVQVEGQGVVMKILRDDTYGDKHQKFIVRTSEGANILIVYNIDIAPRIENLKRGDSVEFTGEYIWNDKGGLIHWTHHDPRGHHAAGWIKHKGRTYQ